jgi:signal transduction histidine kinase
VADDGVGGASLAKGHGLAGLDDRVRAAGGVLAVDSPDGKGTTLTAALPL